MKSPVIIAAAFTAGSMAWSPNAIAQSERWVNPDQPLPPPPVTESGIHNESDEQASPQREPDGLERLTREGAPSSKATEGQKATTEGEEQSSR
jgi:hypothetical protein